MPIEPDSFLDAAEEIQNGDVIQDEEARWRSVAGRAYYAAYLTAREVVRSAYGDPSFDVYHGTLCRELRSDTNPDVAQVGSMLDTLRQNREDADYDLSATLTETQAEFLIGRARTLLGLLPTVEQDIPSGIPRR